MLTHTVRIPSYSGVTLNVILSDILGVVSLTFLRALQDILLKFVYCRNRTSYENFKLKLCMCAQSHALGTHTKFQLEILTVNVISGIVLESL